ncbi:EVE domain-containing protein [Magnetospirillum sulfuroxidans]|uniref:EVE domain-containing protein n=1 Tax=Magnetospirillum sulfuroxidans TaxID=611300 RepID=A0ABS5IDA0_9PROT|nr:EVE domain-containing protein [Magnetospirillum sulfuroxidans]MBR9972396.1 EVE domain-containing protein [Magnetospirillum sulfuroxidans]
MKRWLVKSEPGAWSWDDQVRDGVTAWTGVRNYQASNFLKAMKVGDRCFFYHSVNEKRIVGIVEVVREAYPDPTSDDPRWVCPDLKAVAPVPHPVALADIKADPRLADMALIRQSRLSVMPVDDASWGIICGLAGVAS